MKDQSELITDMCNEKRLLEDEIKILKTLIATHCDPVDATEEAAVIIQQCFDDWEAGLLRLSTAQTTESSE